MMNLSNRALNYIKSLTRDESWTSGELETKEYLLRQKIDSFSGFLRFQLDYSGYELTIKNEPGQAFSLYLFSDKQILNNESLEIEKVGDRLIEICGDHKTAQFTFYITDKGEFCTLDNNDLPNILHSSFDKLIEEYALRNEIYDWDSNPYYYEIMNPIKLEEFMNDFEIIPECSDNYSTWWKRNDLIAVKGVWFDRPEFYFHIYGKDRNECDLLIKDLQRNDIIK